MDVVIPHVGMWIEICLTQRTRPESQAAPHAGAWVEISLTLELFFYSQKGQYELATGPFEMMLY